MSKKHLKNRLEDLLGQMDKRSDTLPFVTAEWQWSLLTSTMVSFTHSLLESNWNLFSPYFVNCTSIKYGTDFVINFFSTAWNILRHKSSSPPCSAFFSIKIHVAWRKVPDIRKWFCHYFLSWYCCLLFMSTVYFRLAFIIEANTMNLDQTTPE